MNHLIDSMSLSRIENSLLVRRDTLAQATSWTFNLILLGLVLAGFVGFLYAQYNRNPEPEEKRIPFKPTTWYSATRNIRAEEYGRDFQTLETQVGYDLS
jgi:hypothetical protein